MTAKKYDAKEIAARFLSETTNEKGEDISPQEKKIDVKNYIPEVVNAKKVAHCIDKETGEMLYSKGFYISEKQSDTIAEVALKLKTNKSAIVRNAVEMYVDYLKSENLI